MIKILLNQICEGGNHLDISVTGDIEFKLHSLLSTLLEPVTPEEEQIFIKILVRTKLNVLKGIEYDPRALEDLYRAELAKGIEVQI